MREPLSGEVVVREGTTVSLACKANGNPGWQFNRKNIWLKFWLEKPLEFWLEIPYRVDRVDVTQEADRN